MNVAMAGHFEYTLDPEFGAFITNINGEGDYKTGKVIIHEKVYYWMLYVEKEKCNLGISNFKITDTKKHILWTLQEYKP